MILVFAKLAVVGPILSNGAFIPQVFNKVSHLTLDGLRHPLDVFEGAFLDDDLMHI